MSDVRLWIGEQPVAAPAPDDRGLAYGDGLFETLRVIAGRPVLAAAHWDRLEAGCGCLGIPVQRFWRAALADFLQGRGDGIVRIQITRGSGGRGYLPPADCHPLTIMSWHAAPVWPESHARDGIAAGTGLLRLACQPALAGLKHLNRLEQVLLREELGRLPDCAELVVRDGEGRLVEGVFSNLFFVRGGVLCTPALTRCGVAGVLRSALLAACAAQGLAVETGDYTSADLADADEAFFCNSVYGIWPLRQWHERSWRPGAVTRQCQAMIAPWFAEA